VYQENLNRQLCPGEVKSSRHGKIASSQHSVRGWGFRVYPPPLGAGFEVGWGFEVQGSGFRL